MARIWRRNPFYASTGIQGQKRGAQPQEGSKIMQDPNHEWRAGVKLIPADNGHFIGWRTDETKVAVRPKRPKRMECPWCEGHGTRVDSRYQRQDPECHMCSGRGYVILAACANCGRSAYLLDEGGPPVCERTACLTAVLPRAKRHYGPWPRFGVNAQNNSSEELSDAEWASYCGV